MTAVVAAFTGVMDHVDEEEVSVLPHLIQSTPLSEAWQHKVIQSKTAAGVGNLRN